MKTQDIFITYPKTDEQVNVLPAFMQALRMQFEVTNDKTYSEEF